MLINCIFAQIEPLNYRMLKYIALFFSVLLVMAACSDRPSDIIPPKQMAAVLTDVHIVDGAMNNIPQVPDSVYKYGMAKYLAVFKKHNTDSAQFNRSYKYYTLHPDVLVNIYDIVLKNLAAKNDSITGLIAKNNTANFKKNTPVGSKMAPKPGVAPNPAMPVKPLVPINSAQRQLMLDRARAHRDSMMKNVKIKHAVPFK
jgi:hypothetical protein